MKKQTPFLGLVTGLVIGISLFTFLYADGASYLSNDPSACVNCHVMNPQYDAWIKGSHSAVATCNDCHAPHGNILGKLAIKGINGFNHSLAFTTNRFPEPIRSRGMNQKVTEAACRSCHEPLVHSTPTLASSETSCVHCHDWRFRQHRGREESGIALRVHHVQAGVVHTADRPCRGTYERHPIA